MAIGPRLSRVVEREREGRVDRGNSMLGEGFGSRGGTPLVFVIVCMSLR